MADPAFKGDDLKELKVAVSEERRTFTMDDRKFTLRYYLYKGERWVRCNPIIGYVPMFNFTVKAVLDEENYGI